MFRTGQHLPLGGAGALGFIRDDHPENDRPDLPHARETGAPRLCGDSTGPPGISRMTVLDRSEHFLAEGRRRAKEATVEIKWVDGDMQEIPLGPHFDAIINIFPSFGYFDHDMEAVHLARSVRTAVPTVQTILPWLGARLASGRRSGNPA
jgi:Methyltransferase domain